MKETVLVCDHCFTRAASVSAVNWLELRPIGLEARKASQKPLEGHFCSSECVRNFLKEESE